MTLKERLTVKKNIKACALDQGFILNDRQVTSIMSSYPLVVAEFKETGGHDTVSRDLLADSLACLVGESEWPLYAVGTAGWNAFCKKVKDYAKTGKVKIVDEFFDEESEYI